MEERAYFVRYPRYFWSLKPPQPLEAERAYVVKKVICLLWDDYENFINDLGERREYLEGYDLKYVKGEPIPVLRVEAPGWPDSGVLVLPDREGRTLMAALPPDVWNAD